MPAGMRHTRVNDAGVSLLETIVALAIATVIFSALGAASLAAVRSVLFSRQNQQAADVLNRAVEQVRGTRFANLAMVDGDLTDPLITGTPKTYVVPNGIGAEPVWSKPTGAITTHITQESPDGKVRFTLARYLTQPADAVVVDGIPSILRLTAVVKWTAYGRPHTKRASTIVTDTRRGLPLPNYVLSPVGPTAATKNPGPGVFVGFGLSVRNLGARDAFNISASAGTWRYYLDNGAGTNTGNGVRDADESTELGNWDSVTGNLAPDTGQLEPNAAPMKFVAQREIAALESGASTVVFTTVSAAQPLLPSATKSAAFTLTVQSGSVSTPPASGTCPAPPAGGVATGGTTLTSFYLTNRPAGNTPTPTFNQLARADCVVQAAQFDYSTEHTADDPLSLGRAILPGGSAGNVAADLAAEWRYQVATSSTVSGVAALRFDFRCTTGGSATAPTFLAMVGSRQNNTGSLNGFTSAASAATPALACPASGWSSVTIPINVTGLSVNASKWIVVRLVTISGSSRVLVNYDAPGAASSVSLPVAP